MNRLYEIISGLRDKEGINDAELARRAKIRQGLLSDLKHNDNQVLKYENLKKIADYFNVPVDFFDSGIIDPSDIPPEPEISDEQLMFALWGDKHQNMTKADLEQVRQFANYIEAQKNGG